MTSRLPDPSAAHHPVTPRQTLGVLEEMCLTLARTHELCGPARHLLAMLVAAATSGPVFWIAPAWAGDAPNPEGMAPIVEPGRFVFVAARRREDLLWTLEECLRSGAVPLAVADLPGPPGMTAVRRLHLAAETGAAQTGQPPLGLILTPGAGGAPGIESRWHLAQAHAPGRDGWILSRRRDRMRPPRQWQLSGRPGRWRLSPQSAKAAPHADGGLVCGPVCIGDPGDPAAAFFERRTRDARERSE